MGEFKKVPVNIWDDYYDDGYVPEGEKQETHIKIDVEEGLIPLGHQKKMLIILLDYMKHNLELNDVIFKLHLRDTTKIYPTLPKSMHSINWDIRVTGLTHKRREKLIEELKVSEISNLYEFYSES